MKRRLIYLDSIRGTAILLVVIGHLIQYNLHGKEADRLFDFIYSFHLPIFFIVSGYLCYITTDVRNIQEYIYMLKKKAISLLLPMMIWPLLIDNFVLTPIWHIPSIEEIVEQLLYPHLWFLQTLFLSFSGYGIYCCVNYQIGSKSRIISCICSVLILALLTGTLFLFLGVEMIKSQILYTAFFIIGILISKYSIIEFLIQNKYIKSLFCIVFLTCVGLWRYNTGNILDVFLKVVISLSAVITLWNIFKHMNGESKVQKILSSLGVHSMGIYVSHWYLLDVIFFMQEGTALNSVELFIVLCFVAIGISYMCIGIEETLSKFEILSIILYGKKIKK